jgi:hypothetical protein
MYHDVMVVVLAFLTLFRWPGFLAVVGVMYHCLDARIAPTADSDDEFQPVNTSVAVKSRTSTTENSNNGAFLDSDIIIDIVPNASETSIPRGKKENQYFVIDNDIGASDSSVQTVIHDTDNSEKTRPTKKSEKRQNHDHYIMIHATVE